MAGASNDGDEMGVMTMTKSGQRLDGEGGQVGWGEGDRDDDDEGNM